MFLSGGYLVVAGRNALKPPIAWTMIIGYMELVANELETLFDCLVFRRDVEHAAVVSIRHRRTMRFQGHIGQQEAGACK